MIKKSTILLVGVFFLLTQACNTRNNFPQEISEENMLGGKDFFTEIKQEIEKLDSLSSEPKVISLKKGTYHFFSKNSYEKELYISNHDQDNPKKVTFLLENLENLTIDGNGSEFIFHGTMIPMAILHCENVKFKNFSIDFGLPHMRQLTILSVDKEKNESTAAVFPRHGYRVEGNKLVFRSEDYIQKPYVAMPFRADARLAYNRQDVSFNPIEIKDLGKGLIQLKGWEQHDFTSTGERFALRTYHRPTPAIFIHLSKNVSFENVRVHYANGMGLLAQMTENITLKGFRVARRGDKDPRYFTAQADATHFSACKGKIISEGGFYEGMADDAINVHGTYLKMTQRVSDYALQGTYMHGQAYGFRWGEVGDEVQFITSKTMELISGKNKIKKIFPVDKPTENGAKVFQIEFENPLEKNISVENSVAIENLTWTPSVYFLKNTIRNNRARGALFSTPKKVVCEGNFFDHTHGTAILLCGDANGWYETGACEDVLIRNNTFRNALTANYQFTNAIISIYPEIPNLKDQKKIFHSNIRIENNQFETFDKPILYAKSVKNLTFIGNTIKKNTDFKPFHWNIYPFFFEKVENVVLSGKIGEKNISIEDVKVNFSEKNVVEIK